MSDANRSLESAAVEVDPSLTAEEKARLLKEALRRQAEEGERKEATDDLRAAADAPQHASSGVAAHEEEMRRRGFEQGRDPSGA